MFRKVGLKFLIPSTLALIVTSGCDDAATQIAREAADRQAQQNAVMAELNQEVAGGTRGLIEADAQARKEIVGVHRDLQTERTRLDTGWDALEQERRQIAGQRRTESLLAPTIQAAGLVAVVVVLLSFCWYALVVLRRSDDTDAPLNEFLIGEILLDRSPLLSSGQKSPSLLEQTQPEDRSAE